MKFEALDEVLTIIDNLHTKGYINDTDYMKGMDNLCNIWGTEFIADRLIDR